MKTAIISDIHANIEALNAVLSDIESLHITEIVCLGDIVGYGPNPNECIATVKSKCSVTLLGNHDAAALDSVSTQNFNINAKIAIEWTSDQLSVEPRTFIENLPMSKIDAEKTYVHATPYEPRMWYYITSIEEAVFNFQFFETKFCFVGHTHIPVIISMDHDQKIKVTQENFFEYIPSDETRYLVNVGSVGQPRDKNPRSCYGIIDTDVCSFVLRRIDYDIKKCQEKMRKNKLPEFLVVRLEEGK
jgi:predicted phosphodiesterase